MSCKVESRLCEHKFPRNTDNLSGIGASFCISVIFDFCISGIYGISVIVQQLFVVLHCYTTAAAGCGVVLPEVSPAEQVQFSRLFDM